MKILINAISARRGGGQTYLSNLLEKFPEGSEDEILILSPETLSLPNGRSNISRLDFPVLVVKYPIYRIIWELFVLPKILSRLKIEVLFCPGGSYSGRVPAGCKLVTTFQNMMPFDTVQRRKYPLGYMRLRNWILERVLLKSMLKSDLVIFISKYARSVIEQRTQNGIVKNVVIPHGIDPIFRRGVTGLKAPDWLPENGYFLYVSTLDVYKAQLEVVEAYEILKNKRKDIQKLILIGPEYAPYGEKVREAIKDKNLSENIIIKEAIPNHELPAVYQNAIVNIFASETENCPFILLEALAAGRPLLVSNKPPMPEFGGEAVMYFDPKKPLELADELDKLLDDEILEKKMSIKALERSSVYNWDHAAKKTWDSIKGILC